MNKRINLYNFDENKIKKIIDSIGVPLLAEGKIDQQYYTDVAILKHSTEEKIIEVLSDEEFQIFCNANIKDDLPSLGVSNIDLVSDINKGFMLVDEEPDIDKFLDILEEDLDPSALWIKETAGDYPMVLYYTDDENWDLNSKVKKIEYKEKEKEC
jgi:hypothetical protein